MAKFTSYIAMFAFIFLLSSGIVRAAEELPPLKPQCKNSGECEFVCNGVGVCHTAAGTCVCGPTGDPEKPVGPVWCTAYAQCFVFCSPQHGNCDLEAQVCRCHPRPSPPPDSDSAHH